MNQLSPWLTLVFFCKFIFSVFNPPWTLTLCSSIIQVDFMLGSYMDDIGISSKQFEDACGKGSKRSFQHGLFEQVRLFYPFSLSLIPDLTSFPRSGPRRTLRFSSEWWSRKILNFNCRLWSCFNKGERGQSARWEIIDWLPGTEFSRTLCSLTWRRALLRARRLRF